VILRYDQLEVHLECVKINPPGGPLQRGGPLATSCSERRGSIGGSILKNMRHTRRQIRLRGEMERAHKRANPGHETRQSSLKAEQ
jgi:hypothetical protein